MSLHGPIKVNHQEVGYWSAQHHDDWEPRPTTTSEETNDE